MATNVDAIRNVQSHDYYESHVDVLTIYESCHDDAESKDDGCCKSLYVITIVVAPAINA